MIYISIPKRCKIDGRRRWHVFVSLEWPFRLGFYLFCPPWYKYWLVSAWVGAAWIRWSEQTGLRGGV